MFLSLVSRHALVFDGTHEREISGMIFTASSSFGMNRTTHSGHGLVDRQSEDFKLS